MSASLGLRTKSSTCSTMRTPCSRKSASATMAVAASTQMVTAVGASHSGRTDWSEALEPTFGVGPRTLSFTDNCHHPHKFLVNRFFLKSIGNWSQDCQRTFIASVPHASLTAVFLHARGSSRSSHLRVKTERHGSAVLGTYVTW